MQSKMPSTYPYYLGGNPTFAGELLPVTNKFSAEPFAHVHLADAPAIDHAIGLAVEAAPAVAALAPFEREAILRDCAQQFRERKAQLAELLMQEAGKPIKDAQGEVQRLIETFEIAAREAVAANGEALNLQTSERTRGYHGFTKRVPIGPCSFISPFNFPLNLAAHKIAPAIAAGCPFILKPASLTPLSAVLLGEVMANTSLPKGAFSILPASRGAADALTTDERLKLLSFTGSPEVGWDLKARAGKKKVVLELGGNAACIVDEATDLATAIPRIVHGAFYQSGQSCISVQRILVHSSLIEAFTGKFVAAVGALRCGDPADPDVFVGPMISTNEAKRLKGWIDEAVAAEAELLCGGQLSGTVLQPTVLRNVPRNLPLYAEEAFGPVALIEPFDSFDAALDKVNQSRFGIHAGIFTSSVQRALRAWDKLDVGGVLINEVPSWRSDAMPYGGVKDSGLGREGVRYAIEDMTEIRTLVFRKDP